MSPIGKKWIVPVIGMGLGLCSIQVSPNDSYPNADDPNEGRAYTFSLLNKKGTKPYKKYTWYLKILNSKS